MAIIQFKIQYCYPPVLWLWVCLVLYPGTRLMSQLEDSPDYRYYHNLILRAEGHLSEGHFEQALQTYQEVCDSYDFVFGRDYKIGIQLAEYLERDEEALELVRSAISHGLDPKEVKKIKSLKKLVNTQGWKRIEKNYDSLHSVSLNPVDVPTRKRVYGMYRKDQKKAMGALLRLGNKAQETYAEKTFAPHSEAQISELKEIIRNGGYPGEKRIRNDYWASTILSHHNSISRTYNRKDTLYPDLKPLLLAALKAGEISPYELALIEDWRIAVVSNRSDPGYGYLTTPKATSQHLTDSLRNVIGLRSVSLRNRLLDVESETGMDLFLPDWVPGKIEVMDRD